MSGRSGHERASNMSHTSRPDGASERETHAHGGADMEMSEIHEVESERASTSEHVTATTTTSSGHGHGEIHEEEEEDHEDLELDEDEEGEEYEDDDGGHGAGGSSPSRRRSRKESSGFPMIDSDDDEEMLRKHVNERVNAAKQNLYSLFASNQTDMMLMGGYNSIIIFLDAGTDVNEPTKCSAAQTVCGWLTFAAIMIVYMARHCMEYHISHKRVHHMLKKKVMYHTARARSQSTTQDVEANFPSSRQSHGNSSGDTHGHGTEKSHHRESSSKPMWFHLGRAVLFGGFVLCMHSQPISCSLDKGDLKDLRFAQASALVVMSMVASASLATLNIDHGHGKGHGAAKGHGGSDEYDGNNRRQSTTQSTRMERGGSTTSRPAGRNTRSVTSRQDRRNTVESRPRGSVASHQNRRSTPLNRGSTRGPQTRGSSPQHFRGPARRSRDEADSRDSVFFRDQGKRRQSSSMVQTSC